MLSLSTVVTKCGSNVNVVEISMSMSVKIYIAHRHETSNVLYALVRSKHERFRMLYKCIVKINEN